MRISDWSSDVCSSDLKPDTHYSVRSFYVMEPVHPAARWAAVRPGARSRSGIDQIVANSRQGRIFLPAKEFRPEHSGDRHICIRNLTPLGSSLSSDRLSCVRLISIDGPRRSEENTSELQSLMRISYAVF